VKKNGFLPPENRSYSPCTIGYRFYHKIFLLLFLEKSTAKVTKASASTGQKTY